MSQIFVIVNKAISLVICPKYLTISQFNILTNCIPRSYAKNTELQILMIII